MKPLKYTVAALALIAVASFTQSAMAQNTGDLVLGVYDSNNTGIAGYEIDLGAFNSLTNNETFNLGTTVTSEFSSDSSANLVFNIAASGGTTGGASGSGEGLAADEIAFTASTLPSGLSSTNSTPTSDLDTETSKVPSNVTLPSSTSSNGTALIAGTLANTTTGSFYNEIVTHNVYGLGSGDLSDLEGAFTSGTTVDLYTDLNGSQTGTPDGSFSISTNGTGQEILTYDALATPEPSAYALGLVAVALFWVLKRRHSVA